VEQHHLYRKRDGCPDDLTVWLCGHCHDRAHGLVGGESKRSARRAAHAAYVAAGRKGEQPIGRPLVYNYDEIRLLAANGLGPSEIARRIGCRRGVVYAALKGFVAP
jgi:hypothetical protein